MAPPTIESVRADVDARLTASKRASERYARALDLYNRGFDKHIIRQRLGWTPDSKTFCRRALMRLGARIDTLEWVLVVVDGGAPIPEEEP